jgi:hypothetical protein
MLERVGQRVAGSVGDDEHVVARIERVKWLAWRGISVQSVASTSCRSYNQI